jgi:hypothetical protein
MALATAQKGTSTIAEYFSKMRGLADEMASAGKWLEDDDLASYILSGLDADYNHVVTAIGAKNEAVSLGELLTQPSSFKQHIALQQGHDSGSSANMASRGGRGGGRGRGRCPCFRPATY